MKITFYILSFYLLFTTFSFAQDSLQTPYFPFTEGDTLVYSVREFSGQYIEDSRIIFTKDSLDKQGTRHLLIDYDGFWPIANKFEVDSLGNVHADHWWGEFWKIFNQSSKENDPWIAYQREEGYELACILSVEERSIFDISNEVKGIEYYYHWDDSTSKIGLQRNYAEWSKKFGVTYKFDYEGGPQYILKGVVKDGVLYGDTTAVFLSTSQEREIPKTVQLFQNYPNPFNPSTRIEFELHQPLNVSLVIYDLPGREVARLIDFEKLPAGTHRRMWEPSSGTGSGIYFYRLRAGGQTMIGKMTLIK
jgi:hypothetical protein